MALVFQKLGTVVPSGDDKYTQTFLRGEQPRTVCEKVAESWAKSYIDYHTKAIEVNQATLKHIEAQRLARAEAERLKLSPEQERLWQLVDKWKNPGTSLGISADPEQWVGVLVKEPATTYRAGRRISECPWMGVAEPSDFPQSIRKPLLEKLCEVHQKTPGQLADWIEEQRRPAKPKYEILSTDTFSIDRRCASTWLIRSGEETIVVERDGKPFQGKPSWSKVLLFGDYVPCSFDEGIRRMREAGWDVQVKQVEPPAPPKPTWPSVKAGDKVKHSRAGTFIVAVLDYDKIGLINVDTGRRWTTPVTDARSGDVYRSLESLTGLWSRAEDWTKLTT